MSDLLRLRPVLDVMQSPLDDQPGLLLRDPMQYTEATLVIPPAIVPLLPRFDGRHTHAELVAIVQGLAPGHDAASLLGELVEALDEAGFLEGPRFARLRNERHAEFARLAIRSAAHAGGSYPDELADLGQTMSRYLYGGRTPRAELRAIAAPHVSPEGGWLTYRSAYRVLPDLPENATIVVLGTSHHGEPNRFGVTRKPFRTPYGETTADTALVDELVRRGGTSVIDEDYCHAMEHSIEFQVVFLQERYGPNVRVLPILCGPLDAPAGRLPEHIDEARRFFELLGDIGTREGSRLFWVLGVDMAHIGGRYGDDAPVTAEKGSMKNVAHLDQQRIERITAADAGGFWELAAGDDELRWCGTSPLYTFLKAMPNVRGELLRYGQWNIDEASVVTFAAMGFGEAPK